MFESREVSPVSNDFPVQTIPTTVITEQSRSARNGSLKHRSNSVISQRQNRRMSMDPSSRGTLSFHNINYVIGGTGTGNKCCKLPCIKPKPAKHILSDVSGVFSTGLNAIMGKSKTLHSNLYENPQVQVDVANLLYWIFSLIVKILLVYLV